MAQAGFNPAGFDYKNFVFDKALVEDARNFKGKNEVIRYLLEDGSTVLQTKDLKGRAVVGLVVGKRDGFNPDSGWGEKADIINRYLFDNGSKLSELAPDRRSQQIFKMNCVLLNARLAESLVKHDVPKIKDKKILAALGNALGLKEDAKPDEIRALAAEVLQKGTQDAQTVLGAINAQYVQDSDLPQEDKDKARMLLISPLAASAVGTRFLDEMSVKAPGLRQAFVHFVDTDRVDAYFKGRAEAVARVGTGVSLVDSDSAPAARPPLPPRPRESIRVQNSCAGLEGLVKAITVPAAEASVVSEAADKLSAQLQTLTGTFNAAYEVASAPLEDVKGIEKDEEAQRVRARDAQLQSARKKLDDLKGFVNGLVADPKLIALNGNERVQALLAYAQSLVEWLSAPY